MMLRPSTAMTKNRGLTPFSQAWSISFGFHSREWLAMSQVPLMMAGDPGAGAPAQDGQGRAGILGHVFLGQDLDQVDHACRSP